MADQKTGKAMKKYGLLHIGKTAGTAANAVIKANNDLKVGHNVKCFGHKIGLRDVVEQDLCKRLMFFIREPTARYVSAFNSRLRKGQPRRFSDWTMREETAFSHFKTPNQLAEALSAEDAETRERAAAAMVAIRHIRKGFEGYLESVALLEQEKKRIYFIGATETFDADFAIMRKIIGVSPDIELPTDDVGSHRTPEGFEQTISELGRRNVQDYYKVDYEIYNWCVKRREELVPLRLAELEAKASAQ
jgi:hypothetical protein